MHLEVDAASLKEFLRAYEGTQTACMHASPQLKAQIHQVKR